jgi:hypothetical protein
VAVKDEKRIDDETVKAFLNHLVQIGSALAQCQQLHDVPQQTQATESTESEAQRCWWAFAIPWMAEAAEFSQEQAS